MTDNDSGFSRRTFMKTAGLAATASALGVGTGVAGADSGIDRQFSNLRVREAAKVWDRGYRGRPDRTIGLTDTGVDARHPDLGPWNGVVTFIEGGEVKLTTQAEVESRTTATLEDSDIYFVVAKLVNIPGHVNGDDVRAVVSLDAEIAGNCRRRGSGAEPDC